MTILGLGDEGIPARVAGTPFPQPAEEWRS
jgi:hypothetical protein